MQKHSKDKLEWFTFDLLSNFPRLTHGSFTKHGGTSSGPYTSLNVGYDLGDNPLSVQSNIELVKKALAIQEIQYTSQSHGINICQIAHQIPQHLANFDALMTDRLQIGLMIKHADCQATIFYDPIHHAVANVHSGWRGNVQNIYACTIQTMKKKHETNPEDLIVCISPSLGPQAAEFINYRRELPVSFWDYQVKPNYFDFWAISEMQLKACGVLPHHIENAYTCTYTHASDFFSYRRKSVKGVPGGHGVMGTVVMLN